MSSLGAMAILLVCHAVAHVYIAAESLASRASLTADPGVTGLTPARPHIVC